MARAHPDPTSAARQLTLDDWAAEIASASPTASEKRSADGARAGVVAEKNHPERDARAVAAVDVEVRHHAAARDLLETPGALLTRTHLRELGLERRAIDAVFRKLPVVALPGYSRPMISAEKYLELINEHTYCDDRVRPSHA
jgi:stage V sporulation protein SpoVS